MSPPLGRILLYTRQIDEMAAFYATHFGYAAHTRPGDRITELRPPATGGVTLMLHPLGKGQKAGQVLVKLVFDVADVPAFCQAAAAKGLIFGKIHDADGYHFANARDPAQNPVQVSSRAFAAPH
ncbi:VOC family protein [Roseicyclus mahoneyensis]|uniref:VOC domain-containing protein n=1 Tax=Roseicyclus mahoneyensis TaxID=164332 RepID=A0A316GKS1_9RHOB|nr:VOC family protein [Roseicyclus mahoneyensis]PWK61412.1 hypothetical protein C7455_10298 [Roseicyclus mahoneyensis]